MLSEETQDLKRKGFNTLLMGDFNAHIENDWPGTLKENNGDVNYNGKLEKDFISHNFLAVMND